jgi:hypothetical protein
VTGDDRQRHHDFTQCRRRAPRNNGAIAIQGGTPTISNNSFISTSCGAGGNDVITLDESNGELPGAAMFGGTGNDTLTGGSGIDFADGEAGNDVISSAAPMTSFNGTPATAATSWTGKPEVIRWCSTARTCPSASRSPTPSPARLSTACASRAISAGSSLDLGGIESIDLNTLGGPDLVTVNDQTATDIFSVNVDLSGPTGTGDAQSDAVIVNGTDLDDVGQISNFGSRIVAVVSTFPAVSIIGAEPASDLLVVNGLGGKRRARRLGPVGRDDRAGAQRRPG